MNITRENIDTLNAVIKLDISKEDYGDKVEKILTDYRKTANIPGFRKGHVPMGMVKKQYGKAVLIDEVNKRDFIYHTIKFLLINYVKFEKNLNTLINDKTIFWFSSSELFLKT